MDLEENEIDTNDDEESVVSSNLATTEAPKSICERCPPHIHIKSKKVTTAEAFKLWELFLEKKKRVHPTLESQFHAFATMMDSRRDGRSINLFRSDYWFKQAKILDDLTITMIDTGISFEKFIEKPPDPPPKGKKKPKKPKIPPEEEPIPPNELTYKQWMKHVKYICKVKGLDLELIKEMLRKCGLPNGEPWHDTPKNETKKSVSSLLVIDPEKCRCICERPSVEYDPFIHLPPPESIFIIQD